MQDIPHHRLPSFTRYVHQVFAFHRSLATLHDARQAPDISPSSVFLAAFHAFLREAADCGFVKEENLRLITNVRAVSELLPALRSYSVPRLGKWIGLGEV